MNTTDNNTTGWVKIDRRILEWEWWDDRNTRDLFIYCILKANHATRQWHGQTIERGSFITSIESLAEGAGLTTRQTRTALDHLQLTGELTSETTNKWRTITICNYDKYQVSEETERQANRQSTRQDNDTQTTNKRQANDKQATTNKNDKNDKNVRNNYSSSSYARASLETETENREADAITPEKETPTPQPPAPDDHGDAYRPIAELYQSLRPQYASETETTNAIRMKINREYHTLLTTEQLGQLFDEFQEAVVAAGKTIDTAQNYRTHFRNWIVRKFEKKQQTQNTNNNGRNQNERPRQIADASQFTDRL